MSGTNFQGRGRDSGRGQKRGCGKDSNSGTSSTIGVSLVNQFLIVKSGLFVLSSMHQQQEQNANKSNSTLIKQAGNKALCVTLQKTT